MLLCSPDYVGQDAVGLYVPGEPRIHSFAFAKPVRLWASPANAGALDLANELAAAFAGLTVSTAEDRGSVASRHSGRFSRFTRRSAPRRAGDATHMLLYLNEDSFVSDARLAEQVKQAREDRLPIVMAHENDPEKGGVPFSRFFETTPQESDSPRGAAIPRVSRALHLSFHCTAGAHRRRSLQGPGEIVLPGAPPRGARRRRAVLGSRADVPRVTPASPSVGVARALGKGPRRDSGPGKGGPPPLEEACRPRRWRPLRTDGPRRRRQRRGIGGAIRLAELAGLADARLRAELVPLPSRKASCHVLGAEADDLEAGKDGTCSPARRLALRRPQCSPAG